MAGFPGWLPSDGRFCSGASGATRCKTSSKALATSLGGSKTCQYIASSPGGRRTCAAYRDLDPGALGELGHPRVRVDAEYGATGGPVLPCADAGAAADI